MRTGATFRDAAEEEWLRYVEHERGRKASTLADYRSAVNAHLAPAFGEVPLEQVTTEMIDRWLTGKLNEGELSRRSLQKLVVLLNGIFRRARRVWKLAENPVSEIERFQIPKQASIDFYSPEEVHALTRAAASQQDGALFLTAALSGLGMGELLALRWRDVDFPAQSLRVTASYTVGKLGTPKLGLGRVVPLVDDVARALARLGERDCWTGPDDLVFAGDSGEPLDGSALRRRFKRAPDAAALRPLRFHDLRHTFGSVAIRTADPREVQEWLGHADFSTTQIYMHYKPRGRGAEAVGGVRDRARTGRAAAVGAGRGVVTSRAVVEDNRGRVVELTEERWSHITEGHPEIQAHGELVLLAVQTPDRAVPGRRANEDWYYLRTETPSAWLKVVVACAEGRGHVVTAHARRSMP